LDIFSWQAVKKGREKGTVGVTGVVQQNYWGLCGGNVREY
jgi:hypothetical protein